MFTYVYVYSQLEVGRKYSYKEKKWDKFQKEEEGGEFLLHYINLTHLDNVPAGPK